MIIMKKNWKSYQYDQWRRAQNHHQAPLETKKTETPNYWIHKLERKKQRESKNVERIKNKNELGTKNFSIRGGFVICIRKICQSTHTYMKQHTHRYIHIHVKQQREREREEGPSSSSGTSWMMSDSSRKTWASFSSSSSSWCGDALFISLHFFFCCYCCFKIFHRTEPTLEEGFSRVFVSLPLLFAIFFF